MGTIRLILALLVVQSHGGRLFNWHVPGLNGRDAVMIFFVISGFYMAMILNKKYVSNKDNKTFYINRALRLFPIYVFVSVVSLAAIFQTGLFISIDYKSDIAGFISRVESLDIGSVILIVTSNIIIFGQDFLWLVSMNTDGLQWAPFENLGPQNGSKFSLNPPMFTVAIELIFYLIAPFLVRKSGTFVLAFFFACLLYHAVTITMFGYTIGLNYHFFPSSMFFFCLGILSFKYIKLLQTEWLTTSYLADVALKTATFCFIFSFVELALRESAILRPIYLQTMLFALFIPTFFQHSKSLVADRFLGDLSYPIYVVHYPVLLYLPVLIGDWYSSVLAGWLIVLVSIMLLICIDRPIDTYRQRLASKA